MGLHRHACDRRGGRRRRSARLEPVRRLAHRHPQLRRTAVLLLCAPAPRPSVPYVSLDEGSIVNAGDVIGYLGMTGYSTREGVNNITVPHLHFGLQLIFDESQKEGVNQIWVDAYALVELLNRNRSYVSRDEATGDYNRVYHFADRSTPKRRPLSPSLQNGRSGVVPAAHHHVPQHPAGPRFCREIRPAAVRFRGGYAIPRRARV